ncbi:serine/threonine-protein kinase, putative [Trypanosoma equiperdum]|uniref:Protein kinase, putative n=2 Tax=Trypanozoon TaxID=39700 RepID=Q57W09_TRYB2|nr:protein kinase, putative [Trypanosoma brucei brucei TREU927]AAX70210.1 protein kinase, putative [Trypanosoma brucei]AAZ13191.1 protein kinase, putative [Trypanosoma brucei brucei TREU927]SCU68028.1 serine/threonine-protein kinase, putative [Trypanosoma equiperdum]
MSEIRRPQGGTSTANSSMGLRQTKRNRERSWSISCSDDNEAVPNEVSGRESLLSNPEIAISVGAAAGGSGVVSSHNVRPSVIGAGTPSVSRFMPHRMGSCVDGWGAMMTSHHRFRDCRGTAQNSNTSPRPIAYVAERLSAREEEGSSGSFGCSNALVANTGISPAYGKMGWVKGVGSATSTTVDRHLAAPVRHITTTRLTKPSKGHCISFEDVDDAEDALCTTSYFPGRSEESHGTWSTARGEHNAPSFTRGEQLRENQCRYAASGVLDQTPRERKEPLRAHGTGPRGGSSSTSNYTICDDSYASSDEDHTTKVTLRGAAANTASPLPPLPSTQQSSIAFSDDHLFATCQSYCSCASSGGREYILVDDSDSDSSSRAETPATGAAQLVTATANGGGPRDCLAEDLPSPENHTPEPKPSTCPQWKETFSPTGSILDLLFPTERCKPVDLNSFSVMSSTMKVSSAEAVSESTPVDHEFSTLRDTRLVEELRPLFHTTFTRESFYEAVEHVISKKYCLEEGVFWGAFKDVEYVGEGSFGFVWRCRTLRGDVVAVKSCPLSLQSRGSVSDALSTLREVVVMRFLGKHGVPYVLPLHSAFFVQGQECLPPDVAISVKWQGSLVPQGEQLCQAQRILPDGREDEYGEKWSNSDVNGSLDGGKQGESVRLPRFLTITTEDTMRCDATIFLVTDLCDGDLENFPHNTDAVRDVGFCVGTVLQAMHEFGILHLDVKPSNILYRRKSMCSQEYSQQQYEQTQCTLGTGTQLGSSGRPATEPAALWSQSDSVPGPYIFYLSDFGNCRIVGPKNSDRVKGAIGTYDYMDLRALKHKMCSRATDCYSLGATLYELMYSRRLYPPCQNPKCRSDVDHTQNCYVKAAERAAVMPTLPRHSQELLHMQRLIAGLLELEPTKRLRVDQFMVLLSLYEAAVLSLSTPSQTVTPSFTA